MNLVWWLIVPIVYILTWVSSWRASTALEVFLLSLLFLIPLLATWLGDEQAPRHPRGKLILYYQRVIETGILLLVSIVPWILDTRANDAIFIKTVFVQVIVFTITIIWFLKVLEEGSFKLVKLPISIAVLVFWWWCIITFITSQYKYASLEELYRFMSYFLIFFIILNNIKERAQVWRIITTFMITTGIVTIYGIFQHFGYDFISWASQSRIPSSLGNPDFFSGYLCITIPIAAGMIFATKSLFNRAAYSILTFLQLLALYYTFTRGGWAAVPVALVFFALLKFWTIGPKNFFANRTYVRFTLAGLVVISTGLAVLFLYKPLQHAKDRLVSTISFGGELASEAKEFLFYAKPYPKYVPADWIANGGDRELLTKNHIYRTMISGTAGVRVTIWTGCWRMFLENPFTMVFGQGLGTMQQTFPQHRPPYYRFKTVSHNTRHAHCEYFEIIAEQGAVGLALFLLIVFIFFQKRLGPLHTPDKWKQNLLYGSLAGVFAHLFENLGSVNLRWTSSAPLFWLIMGMTIVIGRLPDRADMDEIKPKSKARQVFPQQIKPPMEKRKELAPEVKALAYIGCAVLLIFLYIQIVYPFLADIHLRNGVLTRDVPQEWDRAIAEYKKALGYEPTNIEVPYKLAYIYAQRKDWNESLRTYLGITRLAPNYTQIHYNLGITYYNLGKIDDAIQEFEKTVELDWSNDVGFFMLGVCYAAKKEWEKAIWAFNNAPVARQSAHDVGYVADPHYPAANLNLGNIYYRLGRIIEAATQYETVLKIEPGNMDAATKLQWIKEGRAVKWE